MGSNCNNTNYTGKPLAMAYVPWQKWQNIYDPDKGFQCGTIFEELNLPFLGCKTCYTNRQQAIRYSNMPNRQPNMNQRRGTYL